VIAREGSSYQIFNGDTTRATRWRTSGASLLHMGDHATDLNNMLMHADYFGSRRILLEKTSMFLLSWLSMQRLGFS
jgi:hypothetical protein